MLDRTEDFASESNLRDIAFTYLFRELHELLIRIQSDAAADSLKRIDRRTEIFPVLSGNHDSTFCIKIMSSIADQHPVRPPLRKTPVP